MASNIVLLIVLFLALSINVLSQDPSAIAQFDSDEKGILVTRMNSTDRMNITNPAEGLMVYDSTEHRFYFHDGTQWIPFPKENNEWLLNGNSGTTPGTNYVGTTDAQDLVFKSNNVEGLRLQKSTEYLGALGQDDPYTAMVYGTGSVTDDFAWDGAGEEAIVLANNNGGASLVLSSQAINRVVFDATLAPANNKIFSCEHSTDLATDSWLAFNSISDNGSNNHANIIALEHSTGNVGIGGRSFNGGSGILALFNGTAPSSITNGIQFWAADVAGSSELHVLDEAGNTTVLSPHNFTYIPGGPSEDMAWAYHSHNTNLNHTINVDMLKAIRLIEKMTGEQLVYIVDHDNEDSINNPIEPEITDQGEIEDLKAQIRELKEQVRLLIEEKK